jgi:ornithine cyclodeaminase/alanine dehydrogenase-like protein (mu-crystallin family)
MKAAGPPHGGELPYVSSAAIHAALDYPSLISALRTAFAAGAEAVTPAGDRLLLMPAWRHDGDIGVKIVTVFPRNPARGLASVSALYVLLDGATGYPVALLDGEALTLRRTGAASALASTFLSRADSRVLLVVGAGRLARYMAEAHCAARSIERVLVWGRRPERARALAAELVELGIPAQPANDLDAALAEADVVTCATTAREPVVPGKSVRDGAHVDLVGGFTRDMREVDDALVLRAELYVDTFAGTLVEAGDLVQPIERGVLARAHIRAELADLVTGRASGRRDAGAVTLFKSVGTALEDLAAARLVAERLRLPRASS